ncbi:MAG: DUF2116 family Zn-ribbon domain-containing protein [Pirellulales bacterium]|nr:DUF2116 family Zn-ribbon domain-containing protein [Pirellulales bacterium]
MNTITKECVNCGKTITPKSKRHKHCSEYCREKLKTKRKLIKRREHRKQNPLPILFNKCSICDKKFTLTVHNKIYCSSECARKATGRNNMLSERVRSSLWRAMNHVNVKKNNSSLDALGCSLYDFKIYIQSKFKKGMTWDNYGDWQFDHIYPISWCDTPEEAFIYSHYSNIQPLWARDNNMKRDKYIG